MPTTLRNHPPRDESADGLENRIEAHVLSNYPALWRFVMSIAPLRRFANRTIIDLAVRRARFRPSPYGSMAVHGDTANGMADYTSWELMMDRTWFKRHLPPGTLGQEGDRRGPLPPLEALEALFRTPPGQETLSENSSLLFPSFAQWFTDGFLMTDPSDVRKTHTSHHIDFNPLYGLSRAESDAIRAKSQETGQKGRLKTETDPETGEVWAPRYFGPDGAVKPEFKALRPPLRLSEFLSLVGPERAAEIKPTIFAFAGERANTSPYTSMMNILFLREHNRLAGLIEEANPDWDDERVFQTARNVNICLLIKIVVEEYINHISPYHFQLTADPSACWNKPWNKPNWIPIEFNLLYRWHSLTPACFDLADTPVPGERLLFDNSHLTKLGLGPAMQRASTQRAWNMGLLNTAEFLIPVELASVAQGRAHRLASYNDYRAAVGYGRVRRFEQITGHPERIRLLKELYGGDVDKVEFFVGLFAEDVAPRAAVPPLIGRMVALDAFSQALTNPLLSEHAFNPRTFSQVGWREIRKTTRLQQILDRNLGGDTGRYAITMTLPTLI
ncbi:heme peroxidase [Rhodovulum sp. BSW8]|uniref:peroxidase family protein n=1 Tax=Rhodovulum sp. BSW8 TaxID=2259645 RepID=UPI000DE38ECC|nr:peroxidase family protein [Rhodovulum sp. BSW8]RBO53794.1 heme peroxidase [Rhodovulum sp. BSW8]